MASAATLIQPSGEMWEKIRVELNEDVNTRDRDLAAIKEWMAKQPHLPDAWDDGMLLTFLRGCSFSLEKCKRKLDMYFTMKTACPEFYTNRDINAPDLHNLVTRAQGPPLPGLTSNGRRVTICRGLDKNIDASQLFNVCKIALMIGDIRLKEEIEGVGGDIFILDASVVTPNHLSKVSPGIIKKFMICVQEAYPVKLKEVHVINASAFVEKIVNLVKPFLKEKIRKRIFIHTEMDTLYQYVSKDILPEELGGTGGSLLEITKAWTQKLGDYKDWFEAQEAFKANESLRPGNPTNYDELFGIDGSFRQLSID